ncbi:PBCV-specific basic adaptor domain-containing protein [Paramecium bursaria Chlorella virus OR0704.2.2]|nr:PBCV-specific basic adaptor domain-containing protein [Paramecium bursaria Chlorella virus OR0704.2.2]
MWSQTKINILVSYNMDIDTGKVNAKGRRAFTDTKGRTYVKGDGGKKVYVKKLFAPKSSPVIANGGKSSPVSNTGKVNSKKRRVFTDTKGRTYVKGDGGKKAYVKKLFTPKSSPVIAVGGKSSPVIAVGGKSSPVLNTGKINAKGRRVFTDTKGRTYVKGDGGKKVYVKKLFTPKSSPVIAVSGRSSPVLNTDKIDTNKRPEVSIDAKGYGDKKANVRKLITPKSSTNSSPVSIMGKVDTKKRRVFTPKSMTTSNAGKRRDGKMDIDTIAKVWKSKVDARLKPSKEGIEKESLRLKMPAIRLLNNSRALKRSEKIIEIPLTFRKGGAVDSRDILNMRKNNIDPTWFQAQVEYLKKLSDYDIWTVAAYTHFSQEWVGKYQRTGKLEYLPRFRSDMPVPLFPQFVALVDSGYEPMLRDTENPKDPMFVQFKNTKVLAERYMFYTVLASTSMFSQKVIELAVKMYIKDLNRIIFASPPVIRDMVVYRGITKSVFAEQKSSVVQSPYFSSTTYNPKQATRYVGKGKDKYLQRIRVPPGKHMLYVAPFNMFDPHGEYEIVLPGCQFKVTGRDRTMKLGRESYKVTDLTMV